MSWTGKKVAITGAAGFLGSYLCEILVAKGARVVALDDFTIGSPRSTEPFKNDVQIVSCDIVSNNIRQYLEGNQVVFHLAAIANPRSCKEDFDLAFSVNVEGTKNVLDACRGCERVIFLSAAATYGNPEYVPIDEKHPTNGNDPYAITKIMAEYLCTNYHQNYGVPVTIVRNFNTFGPRQSTAYLIPTLITQAMQQKEIEIWNPKPIRDFLYIDNTIDALLRIAESEELIGETVNVGSGKEVEVGALAEKISQIFGGLPIVNLNRDVVGSERLVCDNSKLERMTGWKPVIPFEEGLRRTCSWFQQTAVV